MSVRTIMIASLLGIGCGSDSLFSIEIAESSTAEVSGSGPLGDVTNLVGGLGFSGFADMNIAESEELVNQGVAPGDIEEASLVFFSLTVESPADSDLSFLDEMSVLVEAEGLPQELVASQTDFGSEGSSIEFEVTGVDLTAYIISEALTIKTDVTGGLPPEDTRIRADLVLSVGVTAQGARNAAKQ